MARELKQAMSGRDKITLVSEVRERIQQSWESDRDNRRDAASDLEFLAGNQWPADTRREREAAGRPMLTINKLPQFVRQITNDIRQADLSIKVAPEDDESDPIVARIFDGLIRQIQYQSSAKHVFSAAAEHQVGCGIGWFRVTTEFADDSAFDQELRIKLVRNPLSVYDDPGAIEPDRSDSMWRAVVELWPRKSFEAKWPGRATEGVDTPWNGGDGSFFWSTADTVRVAEYWRKVPYQKRLGLTDTGETIDLTEIPETARGFLPRIIKERVQEAYKIEQYIVSGSEVLEGPHLWPGKNIPIVPVIGGEFPLENRTYRYGGIRFARDPQQLYNYYRTATAEAIALAPKAPYVATARQIGAQKAMWDTAHKTNRPYLIYTPDPEAPGTKPQREHPPELPAALVQEAQIASDDMKSTTGIYDSSLGAKSNETSGVAILRRQTEGDTANYHFIDNLQRSLEYAGRLLIELIPKIYDNERVIRLLGDNDQEQFVPINKVIMQQDGQQVMINDLSQSKFDVRVTIGKGHSSKRAEAAESMMAFMQAVPGAAPVIGDLIAKNFDWPGADEIAKRLRNMVPPQLLQDPDNPQPQQPQPEPPPDPAVIAEQQKAEAKQAQVQIDLRAKQEAAAIDREALEAKLMMEARDREHALMIKQREREIEAQFNVRERALDLEASQDKANVAMEAKRKAAEMKPAAHETSGA